MSEERVEPTLDLSIEGKHWNELAGDFVGSRTPATVHLDPESEREVTELLRAMLAKRLEQLTAVIALKVSEIDFTSPALPERPQLSGLVAVFEKATDAASALREMSPDVWPDDEDGPDEPTEPSPEPSHSTAPAGEEPTDA